jgi:hypothetical protein
MRPICLSQNAQRFILLVKIRALSLSALCNDKFDLLCIMQPVKDLTGQGGFESDF